MITYHYSRGDPRRGCAGFDYDTEAARRHTEGIKAEVEAIFGRDFDWLHMPNLALIIGPYSPDLADPIRKAAGIIEPTMRSGRIPDDGFLLLASSPYDEIGVDRRCGPPQAC